MGGGKDVWEFVSYNQSHCFFSKGNCGYTGKNELEKEELKALGGVQAKGQ